MPGNSIRSQSVTMANHTEAIAGFLCNVNTETAPLTANQHQKILTCNGDAMGTSSITTQNHNISAIFI